MALHHTFHGLLQSSTEEAFCNLKSMDFDGINDRMDLGNVAALDFESNESFSLSAWVKSDDNANRTIMGKQLSTGTEAGYSIFVSNANNRTIFQMNSTVVGTIEVEYNTTPGLTFGQWYHIVATYDGSRTAAGVTFYVDGSVVAGHTITTDTLDTNTIKSSEEFTIGARAATSTDKYWDGNIDESSVWDKELSAAEVTEIFNTGDPQDLTSHSAAANLVGYWRMGDLDDSISSILDRSVNSNNGTPVNMDSGDIVNDVVYKNNKSMLFDGVNEYISAPDNAAFTAQSSPAKFTASVWFKTLEANRAIFGQWDGPTSDRSWFLRLNSGLPAAGVSADGGNVNMKLYNASATKNDGNWHNFVFVFDGNLADASRLKLYIDGTLDGSPDKAVDGAITSMHNSSSLLAVGIIMSTSPSPNLPFAFDGNIDEPAFWNDTALSAGEVTELYNGGVPTDLSAHSQSAGLSFWYRMGDCDDTITTIKDRVSTNDGTPQNMESGDIENDVP